MLDEPDLLIYCQWHPPDDPHSELAEPYCRDWEPPGYVVWTSERELARRFTQAEAAALLLLLIDGDRGWFSYTLEAADAG